MRTFARSRGDECSARTAACTARPSTRAKSRWVSRSTSTAPAPGDQEETDPSFADRVQRVVSLPAQRPQLGLDEGRGGEGEPDLVLHLTLPIQQQKLGECQRRRLTRSSGLSSAATLSWTRPTTRRMANSRSSDWVPK